MTDLPIENVQAMNLEYPAVLPASGYCTDAAWIRYGEELFPLYDEFRHLLWNRKSADQIRALREAPQEFTRIDAWGCEWQYRLAGQEAIVVNRIIHTDEQMENLREPSADEGVPHGFMFLRLTYLRGYSEFLVDLLTEPPGLQHMIDTVVSYNIRQVRIRIENGEYKLNRETGTSLMWFGDDLGMQYALPMPPETWRKFLKPCYAKIFSICHQHGLLVYMHTDGHVGEIIPDLIDCGVRVVNLQYGVDDMNLIRDAARGKLCINMGLDRQRLPFMTPPEIANHVENIVATLGDPAGGLWLTYELGPDIPLDNMYSVLQAVDRYRRTAYS